LASYAGLVRDPRFVRPSLVVAAAIGSLYAMATMLPFVLIETVGLTPTAFGLGMLAQSGSFVLGAFAMRHLLRFVAAHKLVPIGLALIGAGGVLLAVLLRVAEPTFISVMGPVGLLAFGIAFIMPSMMTVSLAPFPTMAGAASALMGFFQMGGGLLGSATAAMMGDPVVAMATVIPVMAGIAVGAHYGLRGAVRRRETSVAGQPVASPPPAE
jgi:MFS transporter, DHA1 family, multidrug resistance protein